MKSLRIYLRITLILFFVLSGSSLCFSGETDLNVISNELDKIENANKNIMSEHDALLAEEALKASQFYKSNIDVLDFKDVDINEALDVISEKTGMNIVAEEYFNKTVTIFLQNIDVFEALKIILESNGLAYRVKNGIIYVMTKEDFEKEFGYKFGDTTNTEIVPIKNGDEAYILKVLKEMKSEDGSVLFDEKTRSFVLVDKQEKLQLMKDMISQMDVPVENEVFILENIKPEDIVPKIRDVLSDNIGKIEIDEDANSVSVVDTADKIEEVRKIIDIYDNEDVELTLHVKVLQITLDDEHENGVDWSAIVSDYKPLKMRLDKDSEWGSENKILSAGTVSSEDYDVLIEALDTVGIVRDVFDTSIDVVTGQEKYLDVESDSLIFQEEDINSNKNKHLNEEARFYLKPKMFGKDNFIVDLSGSIQKIGSNKDNLKPIEIEVKLNDTLVIGGLYKEVYVVNVKRLPFIGKIPFLGSAFKKYRHNLRKTEVAVFVTLKAKNQK